MSTKILAICLSIAIVVASILGVVGVNVVAAANKTAAAEEQEPAEFSEDLSVPEQPPVIVNETAANENADVVVNDDKALEVAASNIDETAGMTFASANIDEVTSASEVTETDVSSLINWLEGQPDIDEEMVLAFIKEYPEVFEGYEVDQAGNYFIRLNHESLREMDAERVTATVKMGLNKTQIDDAIAFPFNLNAEQVKKIVDSKSGQKIDFSEAEIKQFRTELFKAWLENPILFEAWVRLIGDQPIGDGSKVLDHYQTGKNFIEKYDTARNDGKGLNYWLRKNANTGIYYVTDEYVKYVVAFIGLFEDKETIGMALTADKLDHYMLLYGEADLNSMRKATPALYEDPYACLIFNVHLKNGKIGLRIGANFRDKRPEVYNYMVKPQKTTSSSTKKTSRSSTKTTTPSTTPAVTPVNPNPNPNPNPPGPTPPPTPKPDEHKRPIEGTDAPTGGGVNDDPGPGEWKPDQGNSKSDTVDGSQYQPGNSENPDGGNPANYDPGPAADNTDGGTPPATTPIVNNESTNNDDYQGGNTGGNNGGVVAPPAED